MAKGKVLHLGSEGQLLTAQGAKATIRAELAELGFSDLRLTARTIGFTDLARSSCLFVKVHGWKPHPAWARLQEVARANGFRVEAGE